MESIEKSQPFFKVPHNIFDKLKHNHSYFKLLVFLLAYWNRKKQKEWFYITNQEITESTGLSGSVISAGRKHLADSDFIEFKAGEWKGMPSSYHIKPTFLKPFNLKPFKIANLSPLKKEQYIKNKNNKKDVCFNEDVCKLIHETTQKLNAT